MVQAEIIAVCHAGEAEQAQRERDARNKESAAVKGTKYTLVSAATSFAGTILFRSRSHKRILVSLLSHVILQSSFSFSHLKIPVNGTRTISCEGNIAFDLSHPPTSRFVSNVKPSHLERWARDRWNRFSDSLASHDEKH